MVVTLAINGSQIFAPSTQTVRKKYFKNVTICPSGCNQACSHLIAFDKFHTHTRGQHPDDNTCIISISDPFICRANSYTAHRDPLLHCSHRPLLHCSHRPTVTLAHTWPTVTIAPTGPLSLCTSYSPSNPKTFLGVRGP